MNVLGIVGSIRRGRNTERLVREVVSEMAAIDGSVSAELLFTPELDCRPCRVVCHEANCSARLFHRSSRTT